MICSAPVRIDETTVACGRCLPCRIRHRKTWTGRLLAESMHHSFTHFVTLTYNDDWLPFERGEDGAPVVSLRVRHLQLLYKRLRREGLGFRYFGVGEYGNRTGRPHYHVMLFGPTPSDLEAFDRQWQFGFTQVKPLHPAQAGYIARYTVKKLTSDEKTDGYQEPEFSTCSRNPPIGARLVDHLVELQETRGGCEELARTGDVFASFRLEGKLYPLGKTLRNLLRERMGVPTKRKEREELAQEELESIAVLDRHAMMCHAAKWESLQIRQGQYSPGEVF